MITLHILLFLLATLILSYASSISISGSIKLITLLRLNDSKVAFSLLSCAAALPEFFVAIMALFLGAPQLSFGNLIGANIADITLIIGLLAFSSDDLKIDNLSSKKVYWGTLLLGLLPIIVSLDGIVSRVDGIVLLILFCLYSWIVLLDSEFIRKLVGAIPFSIFYIKDGLRIFKKNIVGYILTLFSASLIIFTSVNISNYFGINEIYFGIIFLGLVTTLPELFIRSEEKTKKDPNIVVGAMLGSIVVNSTAILGIISIIKPVVIKADPINLLLYGLFLSIVFILIKTLAYTNKKISKSEGIILILLYILFLISQLYFL